MKYYILTIAVIFLVMGCTLKRSNPLDPNNNEIEVPAEVNLFTLPISSIDVVYLRWDLLNNAEGYYVYRSLNYDGMYDQIATEIPDIGDTLGLYQDFGDELVSGSWYYYKVSGFNEEGLEGYRSDFVFTYYIDGNSPGTK
jgi:hypothetical protein